MKNSKIRLYEAIGEIDPDIVEEAGAKADESRKSPFKFRYLAMAASFCVILAGIILFATRAPASPQPVENAVVPEFSVKESTISAAADQEPVSREDVSSGTAVSARTEAPDYSPVRYSSLLLPEAEINPELEAVSSGGDLSIVSFSESMLSDADAILEGSVGRVYSKHYPYSFYDDKFGKTELYHSFTDTVVYEFTVEKVWYGSGFEPGTTVLIEDEYYPIDPLSPVRQGRSYVIPIYEYGEAIQVWTPNGEIAQGDLTRDASYSTLYEFHPQITKTEDGNYLVASDWKTLCRTPSREVVLEGEEAFDYEGWLSFCLFYPEDFEQGFTALIEAETGTP